MRFTSEELHRAVVALDVIERDGDLDEWECISKEAVKATPSGDPRGNTPIGMAVYGGQLAQRLAGLLGEPRERCEQAAAEVLAPQRHRAIYDALLTYAAKLTGQSPRRESAPAPTPRTVRPVVVNVRRKAGRV